MTEISVSELKKNPVNGRYKRGVELQKLKISPENEISFLYLLYSCTFCMILDALNLWQICRNKYIYIAIYIASYINGKV